MPIYEYKCTECEHTQEALRDYRFRDVDSVCEECEAPAKRVEISKSNFHLKGNDWHDTKGGVR